MPEDIIHELILELKLLALGPVHTTPDKFENAALFLRLGLPSTLIRHENGAFRKRFSNRRNLKTPAFRFLVDGKHLRVNGRFYLINQWFRAPVVCSGKTS